MAITQSFFVPLHCINPLLGRPTQLILQYPTLHLRSLSLPTSQSLSPFFACHLAPTSPCSSPLLYLSLLLLYPPSSTPHLLRRYTILDPHPPLGKLLLIIAPWK